MRKVDRIRNRINVRGINSNEFIALAQLDLPPDTKISARFALLPYSRLLNHFDKRARTAIQDRQLQIVQLNDSVINANPGERREQMLGGGDEHALLHQAGGVTDAGYVASAGFDRKTVEVGAVKHDSRSGRRGQNPQTDRRAAVETHSGASHSSTNCLLVCQRVDV